MPSERLLLHDEETVGLAGKAFDLLVALVSQAGHLMTKDALLGIVWPGLVVEEVNLSVNISAIRKALGRAPNAAEWIETVPRQGYRFKAPVTVDDLAVSDPARLQAIAWPKPIEALPPVAAKMPRRGLTWLAFGALALVLAAWLGSLALRSRQPYAAVAVLPFAADTPANAYLADGIADETIGALTRLPDVRVVPRASVSRLRNADPIEAGRRLDVPAVVTGSFARTGERVTLQVELVDITRAAQTWSTRYEIDLAELPHLQGRLIEDLEHSLRLRAGAGEQTRHLARDPTRNAEAYQAYLQGRFLWNQRSEPALRSAVERFRHAIDLDPSFALAYAALADAYTALGYLSAEPPSATFPVARSYALKAIELDPELSQAHASLAYVRFYFDWDWAGANDAFHRAIDLNPNEPVAHQWYATYLIAAGRADEAMNEIRTAQRLDPLSLAINTDVGFQHYYAGRYAEAVAQLRSVLAMKNDFGLAHLWLARALLELGRLDESLAATRSAEAVAPEWPVLIAARGYTLGVMGRNDEARGVREEMERLSARRFVTAYGMGLVYAGLGEKDQAFARLDEAFAERSHWLVWLRLDPRWKTLRGDPRFADLVGRIKYPE
ncbi:MAG: tetratricopeptide repeat protein [Rudaea sp.]|uniref:winged helix-turn-helix domain-containing tetratricopeptide repeat protein n=1 Tax=Rudaea sp. TaxID=2136325 RepID=UPI0039E3BDA5